jgi:glycosyltransferase involved in cell wall biosynthesis
VLPVFNEATHLVSNLEQLQRHLDTISDRYRGEILVVDDGSSDGSADLADQFAAGKAHVRVLRHSRNFRVGQALRFAFPHCKTDYVVVFDADLSYSPDHIDRLLDAIVSNKAKVVIASPYMAGGSTNAVPRLRLLTSRMANRFLSIVSSSRVHTATGLVRAYDRRFLDSLNLKAMNNDINAEIIYKAELMRGTIMEIPADLDWSHLGDRRSSGIRFSWTTARFAFMGFLFRPFMFFLIPGFVLGAVAIALTFAILVSQDPGIGLALGAGLAALAAIQMLTAGLLSAQSKRYFEELFHLSTSVRRRLAPEAGGLGGPAADDLNGPASSSSDDQTAAQL